MENLRKNVNLSCAKFSDTFLSTEKLKLCNEMKITEDNITQLVTLCEAEDLASSSP